MKKALVTILVSVMILLGLCSCGTETVYEQTGNLGYEVEAEWLSKTVSPSPSTLKTYEYEDYTVMAGSVSYYFYEDPLTEALAFAVENTDAGGEGSSFEGYDPADTQVGGMPAKEVTVKSFNKDRSVKFYGIFTAIDTSEGVYVVAVMTEDEEYISLVDKRNSALMETVVYSDIYDSEVYSGNVLQFGEYVCKVPDWDGYMVESPWWTSRTAEYNGVVNYVFGFDITSVKIIQMDAPELTEEIIHETLGYIFDGNTAPKATVTLSEGTGIESSTGSAVYYELDLHFGEDRSNTVKASAVFVCDEDGQVIACICNTSDSDLTFDYTAMTTSMQNAAPVYDKIEDIYNLATEYTGDNSAVGNLMEAVGFGSYGDYTFELHTDEEPYGISVNYSGKVVSSEDMMTEENSAPVYDFQREAVMMLGMVGNLDYIEIKDADSNIVRYDTDVTKSLLLYDVKEMADDKAILEGYYLDTLY